MYSKFTCIQLPKNSCIIVPALGTSKDIATLEAAQYADEYRKLLSMLQTHWIFIVIKFVCCHGLLGLESINQHPYEMVRKLIMSLKAGNVPLTLFLDAINTIPTYKESGLVNHIRKLIYASAPNMTATSSDKNANQDN
jgi:hypothetical protein